MKDFDDMKPRIAALELETRQWRYLQEDAADARYVPTGHLVFLRQGTLMAVPFNVDKLEFTGKPVPVVADLMQDLNVGISAAGQFSISDSGWLLYASGGVVPDSENSLVWVDQKGTAQPIASFKAPFFGPRISPDGRRIAYEMLHGEQRLWTYDINRGTASQLSHEGKAWCAIWTPDGKRVVFGWWNFGRSNLYWQTSDASLPMERLTTSEMRQFPGSCSPEGATLAFVEAHPGTSGNDILLLDLRNDRRVTPFLSSRSNESYPEISPDGRWIAYCSDESGRNQVYVTPFPGRGGKWQISNEGGTEPIWARNGKQLFYRQGAKVLAVDVRSSGGFSVGKPRLLFEKPDYLNGRPIRSWDISADGKRFLMVKLEEKKPQPVTEMILVQNWLEELKRLAPTGK